MTAWSTITLLIDKGAKWYTGPPTGLRIDKGMDEYGWLDDERLFALSYGRYQYLRFMEHAEKFHSTWFSGVKCAAIADVENTGDVVEIHIYVPKQRYYEDDRADGMDFVTGYKGKRWPEEEREQLISRVEDNWGFRPQIEPVDTLTPPDMVFRKG